MTYETFNKWRQATALGNEDAQKSLEELENNQQ